MQYTETLSIHTQSPIKRESLTEQTIRAIREAILNGTYSLGQKLPENGVLNTTGSGNGLTGSRLATLVR